MLANTVLANYGIKKWNYVIIGKKNAMVEDFEKLENEMLTALKKIHR